MPPPGTGVVTGRASLVAHRVEGGVRVSSAGEWILGLLTAKLASRVANLGSDVIARFEAVETRTTDLETRLTNLGAPPPLTDLDRVKQHPDHRAHGHDARLGHLYTDHDQPRGGRFRHARRLEAARRPGPGDPDRGE